VRTAFRKYVFFEQWLNEQTRMLPIIVVQQDVNLVTYKVDKVERTIDANIKIGMRRLEVWKSRYQPV